MEPILISIIAVILLLLLLATGLHISINFLLVGFASIVALLGIKPALSLLGQTMYYSIATPTFAALPLFVLMGAFAARGGFAKKAYKSMYILTSKLPGSLAVATSFGCAFFGAICGSSLATAAIFGRIALPEMERYKYDKSFSLGTIASSGSFASMIPPSSGLIIYALFTDQSIGKMFLAGIVPGIFTAIVYSLSIIIRVKLNPKLAPRMADQEFTMKEKIVAIKDAWPIILLIFIVLGGIYSGVFTPTEAAAAGALATLFLGIQQGKLNKLSLIKEAIRESAQTCSMIFMIIIGALFFARFVALGQLTDRIAYAVQSWDMQREIILGGILIIWFFLGMILIPTGIKALTLPIIFPIIVSLGYNPIWFGIITQKLSEIAVVTPPVGLNVYTLKGVAGKGTSIEEVFKGIWPFVLCDVVVLIFLLVFPKITLFLPNLLLGK